MPAARWVPVDTDRALDHQLFAEVDVEDPRYLGEGPCVDHPHVIRGQNLSFTDTCKWGANGAARWIECKTCALRLGYWPKVGHTGEYCQQLHPEIVREALNLAPPLHPLTNKTMKLYIQQVVTARKLWATGLPDKPSARTAPGAPGRSLRAYVGPAATGTFQSA